MEKIRNLKIYENMLIVVDMVNGFIEEGVLHDKKIKKIVPRQIELIKENGRRNGLILFIKDTHDKEATEFKRFNQTKHCVRGTNESELIEELKPWEQGDNAISIEKNSTNFMESPQFREIIKKLDNLKEVNIIGCCTDICIFNGAMGLSNYFDEWNKDVVVNVHEDAIATYGEENRQEYVQAAKLLMKQQGINLIKKIK